MKISINHELVYEMLKDQLRAYLYELGSGNENVSTLENSSIYQMSISLRDIVDTETNSHNNAIFMGTDTPDKGIERSKIVSFIKEEISLLESIHNTTSEAKFKEYADEFVLRAKRQIGFTD